MGKGVNNYNKKKTLQEDKNSMVQVTDEDKEKYKRHLYEKLNSGQTKQANKKKKK